MSSAPSAQLESGTGGRCSCTRQGNREVRCREPTQGCHSFLPTDDAHQASQAIPSSATISSRPNASNCPAHPRSSRRPAPKAKALTKLSTRQATAEDFCYRASGAPRASHRSIVPWSDPSQELSRREKIRFTTKRNRSKKLSLLLPLCNSRLATPCIILCSATARSKASKKTSLPSRLTGTSRR
jgi:hypothetical protein